MEVFADKAVYMSAVSRSEAKDLLGDDWVQRHRRIVQQHANQYKRIAWAKVVFLLLETTLFSIQSAYLFDSFPRIKLLRV